MSAEYTRILVISFNILIFPFRYFGPAGINGAQVFSFNVLQEQQRPKLSEAGW